MNFGILFEKVTEEDFSSSSLEELIRQHPDVKGVVSATRKSDSGIFAGVSLVLEP